MSTILVGGGESLKFDVPPGFAGAFGLFSSPAIGQTPEVIKAEPDTEELLKGKFYESDNEESDGGGREATSEELEEEDDPFFREEDDDYAPLRPKNKRRKKRKGACLYDVRTGYWHQYIN